MTPSQMSAIIKELRQDGTLPVCAFQLRSGPIHTGEWQMLKGGIIVVTLSDRDAPPIYIDCIAVDAIAVSNANGPRVANTQANPIPLARAAKPRNHQTRKPS